MKLLKIYKRNLYPGSGRFFNLSKKINLLEMVDCSVVFQLLYKVHWPLQRKLEEMLVRPGQLELLRIPQLTNTHKNVDRYPLPCESFVYLFFLGIFPIWPIRSFPLVPIFITDQ